MVNLLPDRLPLFRRQYENGIYIGMYVHWDVQEAVEENSPYIFTYESTLNCLGGSMRIVYFT